MHTTTETTPGTFTLPFGPQHPALKEPGHFAFTLDSTRGEYVASAHMRLGYAHRGIEKAAEQRTWGQALYLLERVCGICSHTHATAYALGVEALAGVSVPPRAQAIRVVLAELERLHSHLLWLGVTAHQAGFDTLFMYSWRDREIVMDLVETLTGNRVNYSANVLGGVKVDILPIHHVPLQRGLDTLATRATHYLNVVTHDATFLKRTRGVGVITYSQAERLGVVGPTARASGLMRDVRSEAPYAAYTTFPLAPVLASAGDLEARCVVRMQEISASCAYLRDLLTHLPEGELTTRMPRRIPAGEAISRVEAPRGELFYFIKSAGGDRPERVHVSTPTLPNLAAVPALTVGHPLADVPMILAGVDPCFSCNDRTVQIIDPRAEAWTWERVRQLGIATYGDMTHCAEIEGAT